MSSFNTLLQSGKLFSQQVVIIRLSTTRGHTSEEVEGVACVERRTLDPVFCAILVPTVVGGATLQVLQKVRMPGGPAQCWSSPS